MFSGARTSYQAEEGTSASVCCFFESGEHAKRVPKVTKYSIMPLCPSRPVGGFPEVPNRSTLRIVLRHDVEEPQRGVEISEQRRPP